MENIKFLNWPQELKNSRTDEKSKLQISLMLKEARLFIFDEIPHTPGDIDHNTEVPDSLDLPFKCCAFELSGRLISSVQFEYKNGSIDQFDFNYIVVNEVSPTTYEFIVHGMFSGKFMMIKINRNQYTEELFKFLVLVTRKHLQLIRNKKYALGSLSSPKPTLIYKLRNNSLTQKVPNIICVRMGDKTHSSFNAYPQINWNHSWEVRGHWRHCDGIGKDREGNRTVNGFTWVVPHIKGDKTVSPINKIRRVVNA